MKRDPTRSKGAKNRGQLGGNSLSPSSMRVPPPGKNTLCAHVMNTEVKLGVWGMLPLEILLGEILK